MEPSRRSLGAVGTATEVVIDLIYFATEAQDESGGDIWVVEDAFERALELFGVRAGRLTAAFAMRERNDAINGGRKGFGCEALGDQFRSIGGAIAGGDDRNRCV